MEDGIVKQDKTTINNSTTIDGNISAQEHLILNGTIKGNVKIEHFNLFIGPGGKLEGEALAQNVRIRGHMRGDIKATGKVEITREANFTGNILSKSISVEQGAYFDAFVELGQRSADTKMRKGTLAEKSNTQIP